MTTSVCANPQCKQPGTLQCTVCKLAHFCGAACHKKMWPFHQASCKLSMATINLAPKLAAPIAELRNMQVQLWQVADALDRVMRVSPPDKLVVPDPSKPDEQKLMQTSIRKLGYAVTLDDADRCECGRLLQLHIGENDERPTVGDDVLPQMTRAGFTPSIALRLSMMGNSMKLCMALVLALELLSTEHIYVLMHGRELLGTYYVVKGRVRTSEPRLEVKVVEGTDVSSIAQAPGAANDHYALLLRPAGHLDAAATLDPNTAVERDRLSLALDGDLIAKRSLWTKTFPQQPMPALCPKLTPSATVRKLNEEIRNKAIFFAPAAAEHDACLHTVRLQKGIPDWFAVEKIFSSEDIQAMSFGPQFAAIVEDTAHQLLAELFGTPHMQRMKLRAEQMAHAVRAQAAAASGAQLHAQKKAAQASSATASPVAQVLPNGTERPPALEASAAIDASVVLPAANSPAAAAPAVAAPEPVKQQ